MLATSDRAGVGIGDRLISEHFKFPFPYPDVEVDG